MYTPDEWDMFVYLSGEAVMNAQTQLGDAEGPLKNILYFDVEYPFMVEGKKGPGAKWEEMKFLASRFHPDGITVHISNATGKYQLFLGDVRPNVLYFKYRGENKVKNGSDQDPLFKKFMQEAYKKAYIDPK